MEFLYFMNNDIHSVLSDLVEFENLHFIYELF